MNFNIYISPLSRCLKLQNWNPTLKNVKSYPSRQHIGQTLWGLSTIQKMCAQFIECLKFCNGVFFQHSTKTEIYGRVRHLLDVWIQQTNKHWMYTKARWGPIRIQQLSWLNIWSISYTIISSWNVESFAGWPNPIELKPRFDDCWANSSAALDELAALLRDIWEIH